MNKHKVVYLGPKYTFSHEAAQKLFPNAELFHKNSFGEIFKAVQDKLYDYGVLPIDNSCTGSIPETYQYLLEQRRDSLSGKVGVQITHELILPIQHNILARSNLSPNDIKTLYTHRQPYLQCIDWINPNLPNAEPKFTSSTADAAEELFQDKNAVCIGGNILAEELNLTNIFPNIQDFSRNATRFWAVSAIHKALNDNNKTTLAIIIPDQPGMLVKALQLVSSLKINLLNIKTLPMRDDKYFEMNFKDWFVLDLNLSTKSELFNNFFSLLRENRDIVVSSKMLGCYPGFDSESTIEQKEKLPEPRISPTDLLIDLINKGESQEVEFKSSLKYDLRNKGANKELSKVIGKSISGFMNSDGGHLFIGVSDLKEPIGIENDFKIMSKKTDDAYLSTLYQIVIDHIGKEYCQKIHPLFFEYNNKKICTIKIEPSDKPAFFDDGKDKVFYIRVGQSTRPLDAKETLEYVLQRFKSV